MTCADNCSSYSHDRAAVVAAAAALAGWLAGWLFGWGCCGKGCHQSSPRPPPRSSSHPSCTTNQIQMHIPNNRCTHSRAVDEIMVDCTLHVAVVHTVDSPMSPSVRARALPSCFSARKIRASPLLAAVRSIESERNLSITDRGKNRAVKFDGAAGLVR